MTINDEFEFLIELALGQNRYHVVKNGMNLVLTIPSGEKITADLNNDDWAMFWKELSSVGIWKYEKQYVQEAFVCDGESWSISASYEDKKINSTGGNAYPGVKGTRYGVKFKKLLNLLNKRFPGDVHIGWGY